MSEELPDEYIPEELRESEPKPIEQVLYACGFEQKRRVKGLQNASYAMFHGPNPDVRKMLNEVPPTDPVIPDNTLDAVIVRFNKDGTDEVIYRWFVPRTGIPRWKRER